MPNLDAAVTDLVDRLLTAGVPAANDMRDLNLPGVFVTAPTIGYRFGRGDYTADWTAYAVTTAAGRSEALAELGILLDAVAEALDGLPVTGTPADLQPLDGGDLLPAYRLTWTTRIERH